jgi:hypothetical protein
MPVSVMAEVLRGELIRFMTVLVLIVDEELLKTISP